MIDDLLDLPSGWVVIDCHRVSTGQTVEQGTGGSFD